MDLEQELEQLIHRAIAEDVGSGDITSLACLPDTRQTTGIFLLKQSGIIAGLPLIPLLYQIIDPRIQVSLLVQEGSYQKAGSSIAKVTGPACAVLSGERIALNLMQHASGVATITADYVKRVAGLKCDILDTRKTLPGLRALEKYAVAVGGGKNHRDGLDNFFFIKSSHLAFLAGSNMHPIAEAVEKIKSKNIDLPIEIQIENSEDIKEVLRYDFRAIMLRNMSLDDIEKSVSAIRKVNKKIYLAFSGNIAIETIRAIAETGVNGISVSALTHSVPNIDIGMRLK
jgi:nicotinate-nucleotide pyrophosphorylase (carboxylating)